MLRIVLVLAAMVILGCNSTGDDGDRSATLKPGVYQATLIGSGSNIGKSIAIEENLGEGGAYRGRVFLSNGTTSCLIVGAVGKWEAHPDGFLTTGIQMQRRGSCEAEPSPTEAMPDDVTKLRKISNMGYEEYFESSSQPAQWVAFKRL